MWRTRLFLETSRVIPTSSFHANDKDYTIAGYGGYVLYEWLEMHRDRVPCKLATELTILTRQQNI